MAKKPLEVGQQVWLETTSLYFRNAKDERTINEYIIVEANKSSAYAVSVDQLEDFNKDPKRYSFMRRRIVQRNHEVIGNGMGGHYSLWLSPDDFEKNVAYNKEIREVREQAHEIINKLPLSELKKFVNQFN